MAQEFVGPRRWKRITSGLPCPPSTGGTGERLGKAVSGAPNPELLRTSPVIVDDVPAGGQSVREEPVDWDPLKDDCFNCALRKSKLSLLNPVSRVPCFICHRHATATPILLLHHAQSYS